MLTKVTITEAVIFVAVMLCASLAHGINMYNFPYYESDEGTYMAQAWAVSKLGKLAPYTYWYDHAPGGWMLISVWTAITGGYNSFGFSINSGRAFMLVIKVVSAALIYLTARRFTKSYWLAAGAAVIFALSPLAIYFQRRVLLDNIMTFWILVSAVLLLYSKRNRWVTGISGLAFGLAIVSKETAIVLLPGIVYLGWEAEDGKKLSSVVLWLIGMSLPILAYIGYAAGRGELFPYGSKWGGNAPHVSLIGTLADQAKRSGGSWTDPNSLVRTAWRSWLVNDPLIIAAGAGATLINIIYSLKFMANRIAAILAVLYLGFLLRGGVILEFYMLPLIAIFALGIATAIARWINGNERIQGAAGLAIIVLIMMADLAYFGSRVKAGRNIFSSNQTAPQITAINWILKQPNPTAFYAIDNYGYVDLHERNNGNFKYAEYYWKVDKDADISEKVLHNNWKNIDMVAVTPQMKTDIMFNDLPLTKSAIENSKLTTSFERDGWGVEIRKVTNGE